MTAVFLRIVLFMLPLALFILIVKMIRHGRDEDGVIDPRTVRMILAVSIAGITAIALTLIYLNTARDDNHSLEYVPPQTIDGEVEPGHFETPDAEQETKEDEDGG